MQNEKVFALFFLTDFDRYLLYEHNGVTVGFCVPFLAEALTVTLRHQLPPSPASHSFLQLS